VSPVDGDGASGTAALAIDAEGLGRDYGATRALAALDLRVPAGALVGLVGPNGAGKTTAMLLLATLLSPSRGRARVFGRDVTRERAAVRRRLGLVFQEPSVDGLLSVEENLLFAWPASVGRPPAAPSSRRSRGPGSARGPDSRPVSSPAAGGV
jgi:ABC-2 type transport system ATP-binding protein